MRAPIPPTPMAVQKWMARARYLRWCDAALGWLVVLALFGLDTGQLDVRRAGIIAAAVVALCALLPPLRRRWRPVSGLVGVLVSRPLRRGDRAWYVRSDRADLVIVTARRGLRISIAAPELGETESLRVRRTRVFVVPAVTVAG
jgi:hypothetical protein